MLSQLKNAVILLSFLASLSSAYPIFATPPQIVVSIKPIHSIASHVTEGVSEPTLLLPDGASPHTFLLKPSHRQAIQQADFIIWVGENCETHLHKIMQQYPQKTLTLLSSPNVHKLPMRTDRDFSFYAQSQHNHHEGDHHGHDHHGHDHHHGPEDAHIWLSIENAKVITQLIADKLATIDPEHAAQYQANATHYKEKLTRLSEELHQDFKATKPAPYLVFHDAYQYLEKEFNVQSVGTILINPHVPLTAGALSQVQKLIEKHQVACIFYEPEFNYQPLKPILNQKGLTLLELDPLGMQQKAGLGAYEGMMRLLAKQLTSCQSLPTDKN